MIRPPIVVAVVRRELLEVVRNRVLLAAVVLPPLLLVALPIILTSASHPKPLPPEVAANLVAARPEWASLRPDQLVAALGLQQMVLFFLLMPASVPLAIASYSIVGEKQTRSLEAVIAAPIATAELIAGKTIAAVVPSLLTVWLAYVALIGVSGVAFGPELARIVIDPTWLATVFALGPAIGLGSVVLGIAISSRVNDPRAVQQIGTVIILPLIAFMIVQLQSGRLLETREYLIAALGVAALDVAGLRLAVRLFGRESILARWR